MQPTFVISDSMEIEEYIGVKLAAAGIEYEFGLVRKQGLVNTRIAIRAGGGPLVMSILGQEETLAIQRVFGSLSPLGGAFPAPPRLS